MGILIPNQWYVEAPKMFIAGDSIFSKVLAQVLGASLLTSEMLQKGPEPLEVGSFPSVLDSVDRVLLCVEQTASTAEVIWQRDRLWHWFEALTSAADYHAVGFIFIVGDESAQCLDSALRVDSGLASLPGASGVTLWRRTEPLSALVIALNRVGRTDLQTLRTLRANQPKRQALMELKAAILGGVAGQMLDCAKNVATAFQREQVTLDNFCNPPFHQNGNAWRRWISRVVTEGVTQELRTEGGARLPSLSV